MTSYEVQAVLINKKPYGNYHLTKKIALRLVKMLGYKPIKKVHETKNYYRFRIRQPKLFKRFITKKINNILSFVIGYK